MTQKKTVRDVDLQEKRVLYRSPYDINIIEKNGRFEVIDDLRIRATIPTLNYLLKRDCRLGIVTYVKRPDGKVVEQWRTEPIARRLSAIINQPVKTVQDCIGPTVEKAVMNLKPGELLMLENTRFYQEEMVDDDDFAQALAKPFEIIVQDGFPQAHRIHASTTGIARHLPAVMGLYLEKELKELGKIVEDPKRPLVVIIGGAKVSDKIEAIGNLTQVADHILVGGGVANNFIKAVGYPIGGSYTEDIFVDMAKRKKQNILQLAKKLLDQFPQKIVIPQDLIACDNLENPKKLQLVNLKKNKIDPRFSFGDIGPQTTKLFAKIISSGRTIFWNGSMGVFEKEDLAGGTEKIARTVGSCSGKTVISGGDTISVANKLKLENKFGYISQAGGAAFEFLAGKELPALEALQDK